MYIPPETNVRILRDVPLDESYEHTVHFGDSDSESGLIAAQKRFFDNYLAYDLTSYTYQRVQRGYIRVGIKAELLYNCNYLMYQNTAFGDKWFYAFITGIEYINNEVSEIRFELDVMQTWMFNYKMEKCFVERMTPETDYIGENIIPEPVELGEYVYNQSTDEEKYQQLLRDEDLKCYVVVAVCDVGEGSAATAGNCYDSVYSGAKLFVYDIINPDQSINVTELNAKIESYRQRPDAIIAIYYVPSMLFNNTIPANHEVPFGSHSHVVIQRLPHLTEDTTLDAYKPRNLKLLSYPYNFYNVVSGTGGAMSLRYEFFKDGVPVLFITGVMCQPVMMIAWPADYKFIEPEGAMGPDNVPAQLYDAETVTVKDYPTCSWNVDAYKAWVAQNTVPMALNFAKAAIPAVTGGILGGMSNLTAAASSKLQAGTAAATGGGLLGTVINTISAGYTASIQADIFKGTMSTGNVRVANNRQHFYGGRMSITYQYARMIDDFLTRFGYAQNRYMIPTKHNRPNWTYLKTTGCTLHGSIPKDDAVKICKIHDKGCLFLDRQFVLDGMDFSADNTPGDGGLRGYRPQYVINGYNPPA